jgi:Fe2+ transport system protein FeoA
MKEPDDPQPKFARLPNGQRVRIKSREGNAVVAQRLGGLGKGTLAVCSIDKLKPV